ncbi:Rieske 2Fe-2S domain-containing protein [Streptomyces sp. SID8379]|uniref:Rieske (2Fe-2S) protein n=1 Tax=unclassified Streptomyces TaxID=2593676 RepID=UPI00037DD39E|nr:MULTISPECIES: Rieske (2Fe-2S) protein [unclassified Streptomyces]MYW68633.1 Rieske 2Fe-2S domain-containing protein [Streptomyces sp. SID8379]
MTVSQETGSTAVAQETGPVHPDRAAPSRRTVVAAVGAVGLAAALTACGSEDDGGSEPAGNASAAGGGQELGKTSDIPEGGGKIFADQGVVVTQPKKGEFKAFTSTCTHSGCKVTKVEAGTIDCPCHGSKFSIEDGSVKNPPATKPLPAEQITVSGDSISLA